MTPMRRIAADIGYSAKEVLWWSEPQRVEWLKEQVARQPFTSMWAGVMLKLINNPNQQQDELHMNIQERYPTKLIRGQDLHTPIVALITGVKDVEMAKGAGQRPEMVMCVYFENVTTGKPQRIKTHEYTNGLGHAFNGRKVLAKQIAELLGTWDTDEWVGKRIEIYQIDAQAGGRKVKSIAARLPIEKPAAKNGNGKAPATLEERKTSLVAWYDANNRINTSNKDGIGKSVCEIAKEIGFEFNLEEGNNNPSGRLAALVAHLKAQTQPVIEGDVTV
jgi:hypothetical protein